jgi:CRP-like cAMP-binding protein
MSAAHKLSDVAGSLSNVQFRLFDNLERTDFETLAQIFVLRTFRADDPMLRIGDESYEIFFILDGTIKIEIPLVSGNARERIATLQKGNTVGEFSLVRTGRVTADVTAVSSVTALATNRDKFQRVLHSNPALGCLVYRNLSSILVDRLVDTNLLARNVLSQMSVY